MTYRHHGLTSMVLFTAAVLIAMAVMARSSWPAVAGYVIVNLISAFGIAYTYCAKCTCRQHACSHFVMGKVADWLPQRPQGPYTTGDYLGMLAAAGIVFVYPLYWLWKAPWWLAAFFLVGAIACADIMLAVCPHCKNTRCPSAGWKGKKGTADVEKLDSSSV